jgi:hypothetical protein
MRLLRLYQLWDAHSLLKLLALCRLFSPSVARLCRPHAADFP